MERIFGLMQEIYLIRHGKTQGNLAQRYVGRTEEPILEPEWERLAQLGQSLPQMHGIFVSPSLRCMQSAKALFPEFWEEGQAGMGRQGIILDKEAGEVIADFREMDFGEFEYKNYQELNGNPDYQKFIDSNGAAGFPGGEHPERFKARCRLGFAACLKRMETEGWERAAFVVHGGTIMAVMEHFCYPQKGFYDYQTGNGGGFVLELESADPLAAGHSGLPGKKVQSRWEECGREKGSIEKGIQTSGWIKKDGIRKECSGYENRIFRCKDHWGRH